MRPKPNYIIINRRFHWEQRSHSFQEFQKCMHRLNLDLSNALDPNTLKSLRTLGANLMVCLDHSRQSINGSKRGYLQAYREDPIDGIMEEEHLLVNILEEVLQSTRYLETRIETEHRLQEYRESLEMSKSSEAGANYRGFLSDLMSSLDDLSSTAQPEILQIYSIILERTRIAEFLFQQLNQKTNP